MKTQKNRESNLSEERSRMRTPTQKDNMAIIQIIFHLSPQGLASIIPGTRCVQAFD